MDKEIFDFKKHFDAFRNIEKIFYNNIVFNGMCLRPLGIYYMNNGPVWSVSKHRHSFFEAHYILTGTTWTTLNGIEYEIKENNFYIMPPGVFHSHKQQNGISHTGYAIRWEFADEASSLHKNANEFTKSFSLRRYDPIFDQGQALNGITDLLAAAAQALRQWSFSCYS